MQVWYWEKVRAYSYHSVSYTPIPPPYMGRWDDRNAKRRIEAYARDGLDGGTVPLVTKVSLVQLISELTYIWPLLQG